MKKLCSVVLVLALAASIFALGGKDSAPAPSNKTVTVTGLDGNRAATQVEVPFNPQRIAALADFAKDKNAIIGLCTNGGFNVLGNDGRCSIIGTEIGFENIGASDLTSTHGNETSFELLVKLNPQYLFVLDRDAAIQAQGAKLAQEIIENQLVMKTDAYKNGNIVYLDNPAVWYTAEGGITALDIMLQDLEGALLK